MPSPADRVRGRHNDADPPNDPPLTPADEASQRFSALERYAGWLGKDHVAVAVRAGVHALGAAMDIGTDTSPLLAILDKDIGRVPSSDLRKMLRKALGDIRVVLERSGIDGTEREGS